MTTQPQDLFIGSPWMNAAGMLGFAPSSNANARWPLAEPMGAFVTNPISLNLRSPAADRGVSAFAGGALLHTGLPNPGLSRVLRRYASRWEHSGVPIWAHLIGTNPDDVNQMIQRLEGREGIAAIELSLPPEAQGAAALAFVTAAFGELPLVVHLPFTAASQPWLAELPGMGAAALTLGAPRGMLPVESGRLAAGRLYGPALFPQMLSAVHAARRLGIPIIAGAGVYRRQDAQALLDAGASAVQLDTVLWRGWIG